MELYFEDEHASFYLGDARHLDIIPDESVDLILMSPPYWGKRDYGEETVAIWGGDSDCPHQWDIPVRVRGDKSGPHGPSSIIATPTKIGQDGARRGLPSNYCSLCGAWRGSLGLEPTYDCGQHGQKGMLELRPDLNGDEVVYVLEELAKLKRG